MIQQIMSQKPSLVHPQPMEIFLMGMLSLPPATPAKCVLFVNGTMPSSTMHHTTFGAESDVESSSTDNGNSNTQGLEDFTSDVFGVPSSPESHQNTSQSTTANCWCRSSAPLSGGAWTKSPCFSPHNKGCTSIHPKRDSPAGNRTWHVAKDVQVFFVDNEHRKQSCIFCQ